MKKINRLFVTAAFIIAFLSLPVTSSAKTVRRTLKKGKSSVVTVTKMKKVKKIEAKSSNKRVAAVKKMSGKKIQITAKNTGRAKITAKVYKNKKQFSKNVYQITVKASASTGSKDDEPGIVPKTSHRRVTKATPVPTKRPRPTRDPISTVAPRQTLEPIPTEEPMPTMEPTPEPTPYQAKYSYEVSVLNKFEIYENVPIVLYVKTDNPNPNPSDEENNVRADIGAYGEDFLGWDLKYDDIQYIEQDETYSTFFNKVKGGWIYTGRVSEPGFHIVSIQEFDETDKSDSKYGTWHTVDTFEIEVKDGEQSKKAFCEKVIQSVSDDEWEPRWNWVENERYSHGKGLSWNELTVQQKMQRCTIYITENMNYPKVSGVHALGNVKAMIIQENVGADWDTGFTDCQGAAELLLGMAKILGVEAYMDTTTLDGALHVRVQAIIEGQEYYYDATPFQGGYKDWDYII